MPMIKIVAEVFANNTGPEHGKETGPYCNLCSCYRHEPCPHCMLFGQNLETEKDSGPTIRCFKCLQAEAKFKHLQKYRVNTPPSLYIWEALYPQRVLVFIKDYLRKHGWVVIATKDIEEQQDELFKKMLRNMQMEGRRVRKPIEEQKGAEENDSESK